MSANSLQVNTANVVAGLGTFSYTVTQDGMYTVQVKSTLPENSQLEIQVKLNSDVLSDNGGATDDPTPTQKLEGSGASFYAVAGDVVSVVLSSSVPEIDSYGVKSTINFFNGQ